MLGDPPLFINFDAPSEHASAAGMANDLVGQRLVQDSFLLLLRTTRLQAHRLFTCRGFERCRTKLPPIYCMRCGRSIKEKMGVDCVTFLSDASLNLLRFQGFDGHPNSVSDAGHFVFHAGEGGGKLVGLLGLQDG